MKRILSFLAFGLALLSPVLAEDFQLIANPECGVAAVSKDEAKSILLGAETKLSSGIVIKLAVLLGGPAHERVISELTARTPDQFDKHWKKLVFTGKGVMPETVGDEAAMVTYVAKTRGAIGYVSSSAKLDGVKPLNLQ